MVRNKKPEILYNKLETPSRQCKKFDFHYSKLNNRTKNSHLYQTMNLYNKLPPTYRESKSNIFTVKMEKVVGTQGLTWLMVRLYLIYWHFLTVHLEEAFHPENRWSQLGWLLPGRVLSSSPEKHENKKGYKCQSWTSPPLSDDSLERWKSYISFLLAVISQMGEEYNFIIIIIKMCRESI